MDYQKLIPLFGLSFLIFIAISQTQNSYASSLTVSGSAGSNIINFRDISITSDLTPIVSTDKDRYFNGETGVLTIIDHNENVDLSVAETITANAGSEVILLTETGVNTGVFTGSFIANKNEIIYNPVNPTDVPRAQISIDLADPGDITISDVILPETGMGCPFGFEPVLHGLNISLSDGASLNSINSVTLSYANAILLGNDPVNLKMFYQDNPTNSYLMVTELYNDPFNTGANDFVGLSIKTDPNILLIAQGSGAGYAYSGTLGEGTYVPTLETGCSGGGGGGISRAGLVVQALGVLAIAGGSQPNSPPTLGLDQNQKRIVDGGFSFNDNPIDVLQYYTPYPLITTPVGQNNTIKLKIYEEKGLDNIAHVGLSYGLGKGEIFNEGRATIEYDRTFDGKETVTLFDPKHVLGSVNVTTSDVRCGDNGNAVCREFAFHHIFREPLEYNMVATNIWDLDLNGWQNYFNHGIQIVGDSMNPPEEYSGIYKGHIYHLTEAGKNTAVDDEGNNWTFAKTWNRDYIKPVTVDNEILNQEKIGAIEQLGFQYSDGQAIFGVDRVDHRFADTKNQQQIEAQTIMDNLCPDCHKKPFEKIDNIFSYSLPDRHSKLVANENLMKNEDQKARQFLQTFFDQIYHKSPN